MPDPIRFAGLELRFLQDGASTGGGLDLFTTRAEPGAGMPLAHYHESWDETVVGLSGTTAWTVAGQAVVVGPDASLFIPRGTVHSFANHGDEPATFLSILTPGVLGRTYFEEMAALAAAGRPDPATMRALMLRHGLVPVPGG